jgi:hypothetical protein
MAMISQSLSRRQFIGSAGGAAAGAAAFMMWRQADAVSDPSVGRGTTSGPDAPRKVTLHWDQGPDNATGLLFEWGEDGINFPNVVSIAARLTSTEIEFPRPGIYYGRLRAYNDAGVSPPGETLIISVNS